MQIRNISTFTRLGLLAGAILAISVTSSHAAVVTWGAAQSISGDSDVSTAGTLIGAFNVGDGGVAATAINGVNFQSFALDSTSGLVTSGTVGNFTLATTDLFISENSLYGSTAAPFVALSASYKTLLASATIVSGPDTFTLTMNGLTVGQQYQFQWWANTSGLGSQLHTATATGSVTLNDNVTGLAGGLGQFATGTFTADATSQVITFSSAGSAPNFAQVNAFQLRQVPEPSSLGLLGLGMTMLGCRARCRKRA